jgi:hypothetical protein
VSETCEVMRCFERLIHPNSTEGDLPFEDTQYDIEHSDAFYAKSIFKKPDINQEDDEVEENSPLAIAAKPLKQVVLDQRRFIRMSLVRNIARAVSLYGTTQDALIHRVTTVGHDAYDIDQDLLNTEDELMVG